MSGQSRSYYCSVCVLLLQQMVDYAKGEVWWVGVSGEQEAQLG